MLAKSLQEVPISVLGLIFIEITRGPSQRGQLDMTGWIDGISTTGFYFDRDAT